MVVDNKEILVTGKDGQLATAIFQLLPDATFTSRQDLDITNPTQVTEFVGDNKIKAIINCAAYTNTDAAEHDIDTASKVNIGGPRNLANTKVPMIHISTDYVFSGCGHVPYQPSDHTEAISIYGYTKLSGEYPVLMNNRSSIVIRTSWLHSPYGNNFVKKIRELASTKDSINVIDDQIGSPTYAVDLASAIIQIIPQMSEEKGGIYHYTNEGVCSWYDFALEIIEKSGLSCKVNPIPTSEYKSMVRRPYYSVLNKATIKENFGLQIPHWKDGLNRCISMLDSDKQR